MNTIDFTQPEGFPVDQSTLDFLQSQTLFASQAALLGGSQCIISGCVVAGSNVGNGTVVVNGEMLPFVGGVATDYVVIIQTTTNVNYQDAVNGDIVVKPSIATRYATFGTTGAILWADFKRNTTEGVLARLERLEMIAAPDLLLGGTVRIWRKPAANIPVGWQPLAVDSPLRGKFLIGSLASDTDFDPAINTSGVGGSKTKILSVANLPPHTHDFNISENGLDNANQGVPADSDNTSLPKAHGTTQSTGSGTAFSVLNPFAIVDYIEFVGI